MKRITIVLLALAGLASFSAQAQMKPEDAIKLRQSAMKLIGYNFGSIGAMVNDKKPYNKDEAIRNATHVEGLSGQPFEFFIAGSDKGDTKAEPKIWTEMDKFRAAASKMQEEMGKLNVAAKGGNLDAIKAAVGDTGKSCKACHDNYRKE